MKNNILDATVQALQNLPQFEVHAITSEGHPIPWMTVLGNEIANELIIHEHTLATQVQTISVKIFEWGRLVARCQRILDIENRMYRTWKAKLITDRMSANEKEKLTEKVMEAIYRADPAYETWNIRVESATENLSAAQAVLDGFRAKREMLRSSLRPSQDGGMNPSLSVP